MNVRALHKCGLTAGICHFGFNIKTQLIDAQKKKVTETHKMA